MPALDLLWQVSCVWFPKLWDNRDETERGLEQAPVLSVAHILLQQVFIQH